MRTKTDEICRYRWEFMRRNPEFKELWMSYPHWKGHWHESGSVPYTLFYHPESGYLYEEPFYRREKFRHDILNMLGMKNLQSPLPEEFRIKLKHFDIDIDCFFHNDLEDGKAIALPYTKPVGVTWDFTRDDSNWHLIFNAEDSQIYDEYTDIIDSIRKTDPSLLKVSWNMGHWEGRKKRVSSLTETRKTNLEIDLRSWDTALEYGRDGKIVQIINRRLRSSNKYRPVIDANKDPVTFIRNRLKEATRMILKLEYKKLLPM